MHLSNGLGDTTDGLQQPRMFASRLSGWVLHAALGWALCVVGCASPEAVDTGCESGELNGARDCAGGRGGTAGSGGASGAGGATSECPEQGQQCGETAVGACELGSFVCEATGAVCVGEVGPTEETCNASDDDCDGQTDEELSACCDDGESRECGTTTVGACQRGTQTCTGQVWQMCEGSIEPVGEVCDGVDNDCDGNVDEDFPCLGGTSVSCTTSCGSTGTGVCTNQCGIPIGAACAVPAETCNLADDDCDGIVDEDQLVAGPVRLSLGAPLAEIVGEASGNYLVRSSENVGFLSIETRLRRATENGVFQGTEISTRGLLFGFSLVGGEGRLVQSTITVDPAEVLLQARTVSVAGDLVFDGDFETVHNFGSDVSIGLPIVVPGLSDQLVAVVDVSSSSLQDTLQAFRLGTPGTDTAVLSGPDLVTNTGGQTAFSLASTNGNNVVVAYEEGGLVVVRMIDKSSLSVGSTSPSFSGEYPVLASNEAGETALIYTDNGQMAFVLFDSNTLQCRTQPCVATVGTSVERTTDLAFNGDNWLATATLSTGRWGVRVITDDGRQVGALDINEEDDSPRVGSNGTGKALIGTGESLRTYGCD